MKANVRLRRERELRAWSQAKVAEELGTDPATISRWERGLSFPYPYFREKLCILFEKDAQELGLVQHIPQDQPLSSDPTPLPDTQSSMLPLIYDPAIPLASATDVGLVGRDPLLHEIKQHLLHHSNIHKHLSISGLPGVGKTSLLLHLVRDPEVLAHYSDGVLWANLGPRPDTIGQLARWGNLLSVPPPAETSYDAWAEAIHFAIGNRRMLLIIDDAWQLEDALTFKVGGHRCLTMVSTRFPSIALLLADQQHYTLHELGEDEGLTLLQMLAPAIAHCNMEKLRALVRLVGGLPLALTLIGKYLRVQSHNRQLRRIHSAIERLHNLRERLQLSEPYALLERHTSLESGTNLSLQSVVAVSDHMLPSYAKQVLYALSVFPSKPHSFSEEAAIVVSGQPAQVLDLLADCGLLESRESGRYTLHPIITDYASLHLVDTAPRQRFVRYFVHYIVTHTHDEAALSQEYTSLIAALRIAAELDMRDELQQGLHGIRAFLASRHVPMYEQASQEAFGSWLSTLPTHLPPITSF